MTAALQAELDAAGVRYFSARELLRIRHRDIAQRVGITTPFFEASPAVRAELVKVALVCDRLRESFGGPLTVLNGYRPMAYDRAVQSGPSTRSHTNGFAADLTAPAAELPRLRVLAREMHDRREIGGLGLYRGNIHLDTGRWRIWGSQQ